MFALDLHTVEDNVSSVKLKYRNELVKCDEGQLQNRYFTMNSGQLMLIIALRENSNPTHITKSKNLTITKSCTTMTTQYTRHDTFTTAFMPSFCIYILKLKIYFYFWRLSSQYRLLSEDSGLVTYLALWCRVVSDFEQHQLSRVL